VALLSWLRWRYGVLRGVGYSPLHAVIWLRPSLLLPSWVVRLRLRYLRRGVNRKEPPPTNAY
jgi:hypothetical protein